jgi:hypothetical protein
MPEKDTRDLSAMEKDHDSQSAVDKPIWVLLAQRIAKINVASQDKPYLNSYLGGMGIGIVLFLALFLVGKGFGNSGALTRIGAFFLNQVLPVHTEKLVYFKSYLSTSAHLLDNWLIYMLLGIALGGLVSGVRGKRLTKGFLRGPNTTKRRRIVTAFAGGMLVSFGARMAGGGITGLVITSAGLLNVAGWLFLLSLLVSGLIVAYFVRREWF